MKKIQFLLFVVFSFTLYANNTSLEKVKLQLQWKHQFEFAGFYAAKEKGFYEEVGLEVELVEFNETTDITKEVLSGNVQYGLSYASIIAQYFNGAPIVLLANFFKQSPLVLVAQESIQTPADLRGKKVMGLSDSIDNITLLGMLSKFNVKTEDIINIPTTFNLNDFIEKKVDAMSVFTTNELYYLEKQGIAYKLFDPTVYGSKYYDVNLFTSKDEILQHPKRVQKFTEASIKGWEYALAHQEEVIEIILKKYNTQAKSKEALAFEANQIKSIMLQNVYKIGSVDKQRVQLIAENFVENGFIKNFDTKRLELFLYENYINPLRLTFQERAYLEEKKEIKVCVDPNWMPFEAYKNGKYIGLNADFFKLFEQKLKIPFNIVPTETFDASINAMKQNKCDILSLVAPTKQREEYLNFPKPYLNVPLVIATKTNVPSVMDIAFIEKQSIAVVKGYALVEYIQEKYINLEVLEVRDIQEGLGLVEKGKVFGYADSLSAIEYYFQNSNIKELKISAYFDEKLPLGFGVRTDNQKLFDILEKISLTINDEDKKNIMQKWFYMQYKKDFDYELFYQLFTVLLIIFVFAAYRHFIVKRANKELQVRVQEELKKSRDKDQMIFHQNKLVSMGEMIQNIAHQWRQPLSQVNSAVLVIDDILQANAINDAILQEKLTEIESLTQYMSNTIDDFKDFFSNSKIKEKFLLSDLVQRSIDIVGASLKANGIEITVGVDDKISCFGYPNELQQVVVVMLNNAKDALVSAQTPKPKIEIEIESTMKFNKITICDNANGIADAVIEKIFEPYFTTKHKSQGTGLGLYLSNMIIQESFKGRIEVESSTDGSCFKIFINI